MSLEFYVRKDECRFDQDTLLKAIGKGSLGGMCLSLGSAFIHLRRNDLDPGDILGAFRTSGLRTIIAGIQEVYEAGKLSGGSKREAQEESTIRNVFDAVQGALERGKQASPAKTKLFPIGFHGAAGRSLRGSLLPDERIFNVRRKMLLVVMNCRNDKLGLRGAHAIVLDSSLDQAGIFDPNFGWMPLRNGFNGIDISVMLGEFKDHYGITDAVSYQDVTELR